MNVKLLLPAVLLACAVIAQAEDSSSQSGVATSATTPTEANSITGHWDQVLVEKSDDQGVRIGKKDWRIKGPVVEGLRRQRLPDERSFGQKLLGLPIVRLFVPKPMPTPSDDPKYLRWGKSKEPWPAIVENAARGRSSGDPVTHEARTSLVSIGR